MDMDQYDYICKLDLDLILPEHYFETLIHRMNSNPRLGNCSGKPYYIDKVTGNLVSEGCGDENAIGASKFYRRECFKQIGGFVRQVMCMMRGHIWSVPRCKEKFDRQARNVAYIYPACC